MEQRKDEDGLATRVRELQARLDTTLAELKQQTQRSLGYTAFFADSADAIALTDDLGRFLDVNQAFVQLLGHNKDELLGQPSDSISHPDDVPVERALFGALLRRVRDHVDLEKRFRRKDGTWTWARVHAGAAWNADGTVASVFAVVKDTENELRAVTSVRDVEARNRALLDAVPDLLFIMSPDGRFLDCKPARDVPLMLPPSAFIGKRIQDIFPPDLAQRHASKIRDTAETGGSEYDQYSLDLPDGQRHYEAIFSRASTKEVVVAVRDITTRIETERERDNLVTAVGLKAEELTRWKALADRAPDGIVLVHLDRRLAYTNAAFEGLLGRGPLEGLLVRDLLANKSDADAIETSLREQDHFRGELTLLRGDGSTFLCDGVWFVIRNEDGKQTAFGAIVRDRSDAKRAEEEQLLLREQLIDAQQALIRELEAPLLPVGRGVLVMPIVGRMDTARAERLLGTLLEGITTYGARVVIMDITGVPVVDGNVAEGLVRAASAAKLLGAETRLTGVSPAVARELVNYAEQIAMLKPCSTLEQAVSLSLGLKAAKRG